MPASKLKILITGGGTGGHVYPGLAIAKEIKALRPDAEILFVGSPRGIEQKVVPREGFPIEFVDVRYFVRKLSMQNLRTVLIAARAYLKAKKIIRRFQPAVVVGTGGYVSGPVVLAATKAKIPTLIQEQNAFPGLTTRLLAARVDKVAVSHKDAVKRIAKNATVVITGHPVRGQFFNVSRREGRENLQIKSKQRLVLVVGGSGGAEKLNQVILSAAERLLANPQVRIIHVTGKRYYQWACAELAKLGLPTETAERYQLVDFLHDIPFAMAASDLVISRSGGMIHEVAAVGRPALYIPSPNVTDDHQLHNARSMADAGAAILIEEKQLNADILYSEVSSLLTDDSRLESMAANSKKLGKPGAGQRIAKLVLELANK
ncbi:MAG: undecaprenyldiphospho-muramoylpentapeptide beta-N-acetylglucosaminyltransferase [Firmicutes bacterium]|nr:undecaprenyldiphospho-muramoylpentapeptide beta-N-acetylglucosaminyltransferase [Bacillota bacterium]